MIGEALRLIRVFHDKKSKDLAIELDISPSYLSEIENGKKQPSLKLLDKYSEVFNIKSSAIMFFSEEINSSTFRGQTKKNTRDFLLKFLSIIEKLGSTDEDL